MGVKVKVGLTVGVTLIEVGVGLLLEIVGFGVGVTVVFNLLNQEIKIYLHVVL